MEVEVPDYLLPGYASTDNEDLAQRTSDDTDYSDASSGGHQTNVARQLDQFGGQLVMITETEFSDDSEQMDSSEVDSEPEKM